MAVIEGGRVSKDAVEDAVARVIAAMRRNVGDDFTVDDMARIAVYSKFHFMRIFQQVTGLPPARFLATIRLAEAKRLLTSTSLSVTDISHRVGYASVGTFSTRFAQSVGISPTRYRECGGYAPNRPAADLRDVRGGPLGTVCGEVWSGTRPNVPVFVGLFPTPVPQGRPVRCAALPRPGRCLLHGVPFGRWYLLAVSAPGDAGAPEVCNVGPIVLRPGAVTRTVGVRLRPMRVFDPPVLLALRDVRPPRLAAS